MPWIAPVIGAAGSLASGAIGASSASKDRQAAKDAWAQSVKDLEAIGIPTVEAQQIALQHYQSAGQLTPEMTDAVKLGDSNMVGVSTDPAYKEAQLQALSKLQNIGNNGGMMLSDRAALESQMNNINADEAGHRQAILQDAQQRGGYGSGTSVMAQLMNQQNASNQAHNVALNTQAQAQQRALDALLQGGNMAGQMQQTQFGQQAQKAQAQDLIQKWNAENTQGARNANVAARNQAQQYNLQNAQNLSNANTDTANKQELYNKGLQQQNFNNQLAVGQAKANARAGQASNLTQQGNQAAQGWANIGSGVAQSGAAIGQYMQNSQDRAADRSLYAKAHGISTDEEE